MRYRVMFRLKPEKEFEQVTHLFKSEGDADLYADAIINTCPSGFGFKPETSVEEADCRYHDGEELNEYDKCDSCEIEANRNSDHVREDMAYESRVK